MGVYAILVLQPLQFNAHLRSDRGGQLFSTAQSCSFPPQKYVTITEPQIVIKVGLTLACRRTISRNLDELYKRYAKFLE